MVDWSDGFRQHIFKRDIENKKIERGKSGEQDLLLRTFIMIFELQQLLDQRYIIIINNQCPNNLKLSCESSNVNVGRTRDLKR